MRDLIKHKVFIGTFLLSYFLFFLITIQMLDIKRDGFGVGNIAYGFPFTYFYSHCFGGYYLYEGLLGNILFAALLSAFLGVIITFFINNVAPELLSKVSSPEFRSKWYL